MSFRLRRTIYPILQYPLRARFQRVGLQTGFLLVEPTARREGKIYYPEAKTHSSNIPAFPPGCRTYGLEANWGEAPNLLVGGIVFAFDNYF